MARHGLPRRGEEEFDVGIRNTGGLMMDRTVAEAVAKVGPMPDVLKVGADSKPKAVAGAAPAPLRQRGSGEMQAGGAGRGKQPVKAIANTGRVVGPQCI